jgi:hypothetical protein
MGSCISVVKQKIHVLGLCVITNDMGLMKQIFSMSGHRNVKDIFCLSYKKGYKSQFHSWLLLECDTFLLTTGPFHYCAKVLLLMR